MQPLSLPNLLIRLEHFILLVASLLLYSRVEGNWWLFLLLILVPDVSMIGYVANPSIGSTIYNVVHTMAIPVILLAIALATGWLLGMQLSLIWIAHINIDRVVGYGLKYPTVFKDTHLQHI